jgi:putative ABC transport system ATP-binding protein
MTSSVPSPTTTRLLEADDLTKSFPGRDGGAPVPVLRGISLAVAPGELVAVVGPSGSGKSTLLYCLSGLEVPTSGRVVVAGTDLASLRGTRAARFRREHIGFVFQSYNLLPALSVRENVGLPARLAGHPVSRDAIDAALELVGLAGLGSAAPSTLSGGQQQRVAIARVLLAEPPVVFADEPTGALDAVSGDQVLTELRNLAGRGRSVVMVTHDLEAATRADRVLVLRDGALHAELVAPSAQDVFDAVAAAAVPAAAGSAGETRA